MLADKDRIFTNIYGTFDKSLKGAMARGHWDGTKGFIDKGADWIIANDVTGDTMGGATNTVHIVSGDEVESLPEMPKEDVAHALVERIIDAVTR